MFIFLLIPFDTRDCYYFQSNLRLVLLINPNLGGLCEGFVLRKDGEKLPPPFSVSNSLKLCLKLKIWYVSTKTYVVSENVPYIPFSTKTLLIFVMSAFF